MRTPSICSQVMARYPTEKLHQIWKDVLLNQFHDVLPGSSIGMVYDDTDKIYAAAEKEGTALLKAALQHLASGTKIILLV